MISLAVLRLWMFIHYTTNYHMGRIKRKHTLEHAQIAQIQIILCTHKVSSWPLLSIWSMFCDIDFLVFS